MAGKADHHRELKWIPWKRYALMLEIDGKKTILLGRFRFRSSADNIVDRLSPYRGYEPFVIDTRPKARGSENG